MTQMAQMNGTRDEASEFGEVTCGPDGILLPGHGLICGICVICG